MGTTTDYRERQRTAAGTANSREAVVCGACGLCFAQIPARNDGSDHPLHGSCPRCGERERVGARRG